MHRRVDPTDPNDATDALDGVLDRSTPRRANASRRDRDRVNRRAARSGIARFSAS